MRKILLPLLLSVLLSSCAVYTIAQGKANIHIPEVTGLPETRLRFIESGSTAESAEEKEIEVVGVSSEYPDEISTLAIPYNYSPKEENLSIETEKKPLKLLFLPLEESAKLDEIVSSIKALETDFIFATGEKEQLLELSKIIGKDAVLTEGGMVIYSTTLKSMDSDSASFNLNEEKSIETVTMNTFKGLPPSSEEIDEYLPLLEDESEKFSSISIDEDTVIFALSAQEPSSEDWIAFTPYPYRSTHEFTTSEYFKDNGYIDVYRATHYSAETDPGITRESGDVFERMDFIYVKNALPLSSVTFSVAGMTNRAIYAEILIP